MAQNLLTNTMNMSAQTSQMIPQCGPVFLGRGSKHDVKAFEIKMLNAAEQECIENAKKYAMDQCVKNQTLSQKRGQVMYILSRVYIGSINYDVDEASLRSYFEPFGPVKSIMMSQDQFTQRHKGYAFLEFQYPEAASLALEQMNGAVVNGRSLKVGRPSNLPMTNPIVNEFLEAGRASPRIYVSSIHPELNSVDIETIFEPFGEIVSCKLEPDPRDPKLHLGFGFIEYKNAESMQEAVTNMNLFDLGGKFLRVCRAITPPDVIASSSSSANETTTSTNASANQNVASTDAAPFLSESNVPQKSATFSPTSSKMTEDAAAAAASDLFNSLQQHPDVAKSVSGATADSASNFSTKNSLSNSNTATLKGTAVTGWDDDDLVDADGSELKGEALEKRNRKRETEEQNQAEDEVDEEKWSSLTLCLSNMIPVSECQTHQDRDQLEKDVADECGKFGKVESVDIDYSNRSTLEEEEETSMSNSEKFAKIYVRFLSQEGMKTTMRVMNGRYFDGRKIKVEIAMARQ